MFNECDILLIKGNFLENLEKEKTWVLKYFASEQGKNFAAYYLTFWDKLGVGGRKFSKLFADHTGFYNPHLFREIGRINLLWEAFKKAEKEKDFSTMSKLKSGKYQVS